MISYLRESLSDKQKKDLEQAKADWRNITDLPDYPDIDFPLAITFL